MTSKQKIYAIIYAINGCTKEIKYIPASISTGSSLYKVSDYIKDRYEKMIENIKLINKFNKNDIPIETFSDFNTKYSSTCNHSIYTHTIKYDNNTYAWYAVLYESDITLSLNNFDIDVLTYQTDLSENIKIIQIDHETHDKSTLIKRMKEESVPIKTAFDAVYEHENVDISTCCAVNHGIHIEFKAAKTGKIARWEIHTAQSLYKNTEVT